VVRPRRVVRFARLIHRRVCVPGGPAVALPPATILDCYKAQVSNGWTVVSINDDWTTVF